MLASKYDFQKHKRNESNSQKFSSRNLANKKFTRCFGGGLGGGFGRWKNSFFTSCCETFGSKKQS